LHVVPRGQGPSEKVLLWGTRRSTFPFACTSCSSSQIPRRFLKELLKSRYLEAASTLSEYELDKGTKKRNIQSKHM
jgi:hypothetical protein